jgi:hypothetical protein
VILKLTENEPVRFELPNGAIIRVEARSPDEFIVQRENVPRELTIVVNSFPASHVFHSMFFTVQTKMYTSERPPIGRATSSGTNDS